MIDRIAKALCDDELPGTWEHSSDVSREVWRRRARKSVAVIVGSLLPYAYESRVVAPRSQLSPDGGHPSGLAHERRPEPTSEEWR